MIFVRPIALLLLATASAAAAQASDDGDCRNGAFPVENPAPGLAVISRSGRAWFLDDSSGCPRAGARCRQRSYVLPGNHIVTGRTQGAYVCAYYPSRGGTAGWLEAARIRPLPVNPKPPLAAWVGSWSDEGNPQVRFTRRRSGLRVDGEAYWPAPNPGRLFPGGPNIGNMGEAMRVTGNSGHAAECNVTFTLLGEFLVAADPDLHCGGMNVSFSGVYRRVGR